MPNGNGNGAGTNERDWAAEYLDPFTTLGTFGDPTGKEIGPPTIDPEARFAGMTEENKASVKAEIAGLEKRLKTSELHRAQALMQQGARTTDAQTLLQSGQTGRRFGRVVDPTRAKPTPFQLRLQHIMRIARGA